MSAKLNHTIVFCRDQNRSATFFAQMLGRSAPSRFGHFLVVELDNDVSLDFLEHGKDAKIAKQHYAFLVGEADFDAVFARIRARELPYWADPAKAHPNEINHHFGGRGVYFEDPDGHLLEAITQPYGGGTVSGTT